MAGHDVGLGYLCAAGAAIASAGWLDALLYGSTRRGIVFSGSEPPGQDIGLETFAFMRTPPGRKFGNLVYVSGGSDETKKRRWAGWNAETVKGAIHGHRNRLWMRGRKGSASSSVISGRNSSRETLETMKGFGMGAGEVMGMAIQCETVTKVVVEETGSIDIEGGSVRSGRSGRSGANGP
jgi:hypothetical protein